jgi:2-phospho-L-lactate guanylyltransferase
MSVMQLDGFMGSRSWIALVPVKASASSKSRLHATEDRHELAHAMAQDTITALVSTPAIQQVYIVTAGAGTFLEDSKLAYVHDDEVGNLNGSLCLGAANIAKNHRGYGLAIVLADLPCLTAHVMSAVLQDVEELSVVSDSTGTGSTMLLHPDGSAIPASVKPRFGHHSCAAHVAAGAVNIAPVLPTDIRVRAQRDVDTPIELWDAQRLGVGAHTRKWGDQQC